MISADEEDRFSTDVIDRRTDVFATELLRQFSFQLMETDILMGTLTTDQTVVRQTDKEDMRQKTDTKHQTGHGKTTDQTSLQHVCLFGRPETVWKTGSHLLGTVYGSVLV